MGKNLSRISYSLGIFALLWLLPPRAIAEVSDSCAVTLEQLTEDLLQDLPSYANRVIQRSQTFGSKTTTYVITTGKPEFNPLPLINTQYTPLFPDTTKQVFFTSLERQYNQKQVTQAQNYYWMFLTPTSQGWQMVMLFAQLGKNSAPIDNTQGIIGQAVRTWLRDYNAANCSE